MYFYSRINPDCYEQIMGNIKNLHISTMKQRIYLNNIMLNYQCTFPYKLPSISPVNNYLPPLFPPTVLIEIPLYPDARSHTQLFQYYYFSR